MKIGSAVSKFELKFEMLLEHWDHQQLEEFRRSVGIHPELEVAGKRIDDTDVLVDYQMPVLRTQKYANYLVMKLIGKGDTFRQVIKKSGVTPSEYSQIKNQYTRHVFSFVSSDGRHLRANSMSKLVLLIKQAGIRDIKVSTARKKIEEGGVYTYYGTYIGTFSRSTYSRRLIMEDKHHKPLTSAWWE